MRSPQRSVEEPESIVRRWIFASLIGMKRELAVVLICISLLGRVELLFKCIRAISLCESFTAFARFSVAVLILSSSGAGSSLHINKVRPSLMI